MLRILMDALAWKPPGSRIGSGHAEPRPAKAIWRAGKAAAPEYSLRAKAHPRNRSRVREHQVLAVAYSYSAGACPASILATKSRESNSERSTHKAVAADDPAAGTLV